MTVHEEVPGWKLEAFRDQLRLLARVELDARLRHES